jgi:hypothetical protein
MSPAVTARTGASRATRPTGGLVAARKGGVKAATVIAAGIGAMKIDRRGCGKPDATGAARSLIQIPPSLNWRL